MPAQNLSGSVTLNGIDDRELVQVLEVKVRHENSMTFNPQQLQPIGGQPQRYNNANLSWANEHGLEGVREIVTLLLKKETKLEAA